MAVEHTHKGHRSRLRLRAEQEGLASFQPHEALELLLFPVLPQRDVNPLAHTLTEKFGSLGGVMEAPQEQLEAMPGLGQCSAAWLALLNRAAKRYAELSLKDRPKFDKLALVEKHCAQLFKGVTEEQMWIFSTNLSGHLLGSTLVCRGCNRRGVALRDLMEPLIFHRAQCAVLVQWRRKGNLTIEHWDVELTRALARQTGMLNMLLLDSVLMAGKTTISMRRERTYQLRGEGGLNEAGPPFDNWLEEGPQEAPGQGAAPERDRPEEW